MAEWKKYQPNRKSTKTQFVSNRDARKREWDSNPRSVNHRNARRSGIRESNPPLMTHRDAVRIARVSMCILIVGVAVGIKALFPNFVDNIRSDALRIIRGNVDYRSAFAVMGKVAAGEESIKDGAMEVYEYAFKISDGEAVEAMEDDAKNNANTDKNTAENAENPSEKAEI